MDIKNYFDKELVSTIIHTVAGGVAGYLSYAARSPSYGLAIAILGLAVTYLLVRTFLKVSEDQKWWLGNGFIIFLFSWLIVWTIFYNIVVM